MKNFKILDTVLIMVGAVAFITSSYLLLDYGDENSVVYENKNESIAELIRLKKDVRRKYKQNISWTPISKPSKVYNLDQIYTGESSAALIKFTDGTDLKIASNTLIVVTTKSDHNELELLRGTVFHKVKKGKKLVLKTKTEKKSISGDNSLVKLTKGKKVIKITVLKGKVEVNEIKEVEKISAEGKPEIQEVVVESKIFVEPEVNAQEEMAQEDILAFKELDQIDSSLGIENEADESIPMTEEEVILAVNKIEQPEEEIVSEEEPEVIPDPPEEAPEEVVMPAPKPSTPAAVKKIVKPKSKPKAKVKEKIVETEIPEKKLEDEDVDTPEGLVETPEKFVETEDTEEVYEELREVTVEEEVYKLPAWESSFVEAEEEAQVGAADKEGREPNSKTSMRKLNVKKNHYFTYFGYSSRNFKQGATVDLKTSTFDFIFNYRNILLPPKWHVDLDFKTSLAQLDKGNRAETVYFVDADARVGYAFDFVKEPYKFMLMGGIYTTAMFVQNNAFGYQTLIYPQIYPSIRRLYKSGETLNVYIKIMPLGSGSDELAIAVGSRWRVPGWWKFKALSYGLEYSTLKYTEDSTAVENNSYNVNFGVGF